MNKQKGKLKKRINREHRKSMDLKSKYALTRENLQGSISQQGQTTY